MSTSILEHIVHKQLPAMNCDRVDLGVLSASGYMMLARSCSEQLIPTALRWLWQENARGSHIFVRPAGIHRLSLVDDLSAPAIAEMKRAGFEPSIVVETSPANFQVWLNHGRVLDQHTSTLAARELARRFGGDPSSADWRHFGRLAGFTNQKDKRRLPNGLAPFVKLREASGRIYQTAAQFLEEVISIVEREKADRAKRQRAAPPRYEGEFKSPQTSHTDSRYQGDLHRADLAWAIHAASRGLSELEIRDRILYARELSKKGRPARQLAYAERTTTKAFEITLRTH